MTIENLNTLVIDMTAENGNKIEINGEKIDTSKIQSININIEDGIATIRTIEKRYMKFGDYA